VVLLVTLYRPVAQGVSDFLKHTDVALSGFTVNVFVCY
jgi:hypothetical protein